jgi:putative DNA primase/helicase
MTAAEQFRKAIAAAGLRPPDVIEAGKLHRFPGIGKRDGNTAGWCKLFADGLGGCFGDWAEDISEHWQANPDKPFTTAEREAFSHHIEEAKAQAETERKTKQAKAATKAAATWQAATPATDDHPYLVCKSVSAHGLRVHGHGRLIVPMRDNGELHSLQFIDADGNKLFLSGGRVKGCSHVIGTLDGAAALCIAEGYATGASIHAATRYPVAVAFNAGNLAAVAKAMRARCPELRLILCADDDYRRDGNPGKTKATEAAHAVGGAVAMPDFGPERPEGATDFNDLATHRGLEAVRGAVERATTSARGEQQPGAEDAPPADATDDTQDGISCVLAEAGLSALPGSPRAGVVEAALRALADLLRGADSLRRAVVRNAASEILKARGVNSPAALVDAALGTAAPSDAATGQGTVLTLTDPRPWPDPVNGAKLLDEIARIFTRYVVLPEGGADAAALWVLHTYLIFVLYVSPILALTSPQKRCGKSTLLDVLRALVHRAVGASNISAAALFRVIEKLTPTLLIDEADTFLADHEELRGILNAGHTRSTAQVVRTVGDDHEPRIFGTFCPKAIAAIGVLPGTIEDRAIIVRMQRRAPGESIERLRRDHIDAELELLRRMVGRWAADNATVIGDADPDVSTMLNDRAADNWRPLLAIADAAGGDWPARARKAALLLSGEAADDSDVKVQLLSDLRDIFTERDADKLPSETLVEDLVKLETRPWAEWRRGGKPLTLNGLARLLKLFAIHPKTVRIGVQTPKGYDRSDFSDAWERYVPSVGGDSNRHNATTPAALGENPLSQPQQAQGVWRFEKQRKPLGERTCGGVADENVDLEEWVVS